MATPIDVLEGGVLVHGEPEQIAAWSRAAGETPLATWIAAAASDAAAAAGEQTERTFPAIIMLEHPFEFAGKQIASLEFRRGRAGDIKGLKLSDELPSDQLMLIASRMCGQPLKVIEMLDVDDAAEVLGIALVFYGRCLGGGKKR